MEEKKYGLIKLTTGETLVGDISLSTETHTTIRNPLVYQVVSLSNAFGIKIRDFLQFKKWFDFSTDTESVISNLMIVSIATADITIIKFYEAELQRHIEKLQAEKLRLAAELESSDGQIEDAEEAAEKNNNIQGNLSLDFNFKDQDQLNMFMENIQMGIENLLDEMNQNMDDDDMDDEDNEQDIHESPEPEIKSKSDLPPKSKPSAKSKKVKQKVLPSTFNYKVDPAADPKDPSSWSDNPSDYLKE
jgi:hypothetical protein